MIDFNDPSLIGDRINHCIDAALVLEESFQPSRDYLGASRIGVDCDRALQYEFAKVPVDPENEYDGRLLRVFERGHWIEEAMAGWLRKAGFGLVVEKKDGGQFGFSTLGDLVKGHCDGIFVAGPTHLGPWPRLWECKGLEQRYFLGLKRKGLIETFPTYFAQCQYYMHHFKLTENPALFSAVNMNRMEIHWEQVEYLPNYIETLNNKARRIIAACDAGELLPRGVKNFKCNMCNWKLRCRG